MCVYACMSVQGVDLYTPNAARLGAVLEFHTGFLNEGGYPPSYSPYSPPQRPVSNPFVCSGTTLKLAYSPTYQVGLTGMERMGWDIKTKLPQTLAYVQNWDWKLGKDACGEFMYCFESLTHGKPAPK